MQIFHIFCSCLDTSRQLPTTSSTMGVGNSSVVEPAPLDMEVLRGCGFESNCSPPAGPSCYRYALTCLETEINLAPHMAALPLRRITSQCASMETALQF